MISMLIQHRIFNLPLQTVHRWVLELEHGRRNDEEEPVSERSENVTKPQIS